MHQLKAAVDRVMEWVLVALMGIMVVNVLWQVATRFILSNPSSYTEELARFLLIWVGILGAGYGVGKRIHLAIELFPRKQTGRRRIYTEMFIEVSVLLFALTVMIVGGIDLVAITLALDQTSAALQVKLGYVYAVLPLSGALIVFYTVLHLVALRKKLVGAPVDLDDIDLDDSDDAPLSDHMLE